MRIFRDLLFLHGHVASPRTARELADVPGDEAAAEAPRSRRPTAAAAPCERTAARGARGFGRGVTTLCSTSLSSFR